MIKYVVLFLLFAGAVYISDGAMLAAIPAILAAWVYADGSRLRIHNYDGTAHPGVYALVTFLFFIVGFPWYLIQRRELVRGGMRFRSATRYVFLKPLIGEGTEPRACRVVSMVPRKITKSAYVVDLSPPIIAPSNGEKLSRFIVRVEGRDVFDLRAADHADVVSVFKWEDAGVEASLTKNPLFPAEMIGSDVEYIADAHRA